MQGTCKGQPLQQLSPHQSCPRENRVGQVANLPSRAHIAGRDGRCGFRLSSSSAPLMTQTAAEGICRFLLSESPSHILCQIANFPWHGIGFSPLDNSVISEVDWREVWPCWVDRLPVTLGAQAAGDLAS